MAHLSHPARVFYTSYPQLLILGWVRNDRKSSAQGNLLSCPTGHGNLARGIRVDKKTHPIQTLGWIAGLK
jgi:hypothetical protein